MRKGKGLRIFTASVLAAVQILSCVPSAFAGETEWLQEEAVFEEVNQAADLAENGDREIGQAVPTEDMPAVDISEENELLSSDENAAYELFEDEDAAYELFEEEDCVEIEEYEMASEEEAALLADEEYPDDFEEIISDETVTEQIENMAYANTVEIVYASEGSGSISSTGETVAAGQTPQGCLATPSAGAYFAGWTRYYNVVDENGKNVIFSLGSSATDRYLFRVSGIYGDVVSENLMLIPDEDDWYCNAVLAIYNYETLSFETTYPVYKINKITYTAHFVPKGTVRVLLTVNNFDYGYIGRDDFAVRLYNQDHASTQVDCPTEYVTYTMNAYGVPDILSAVARDGYRFDHWELNGERYNDHPGNSANADKTYWFYHPSFQRWESYQGSYFNGKEYRINNWGFIDKTSSGEVMRSEFADNYQRNKDQIMVMTAVFVPDTAEETYTVTYKSSDKKMGTVSVQSETFTLGSTPALKGSKANEKYGYVFKEWQDEAGNRVSSDQHFVPNAASISGNVTYTAVFEEMEPGRYVFETKDGHGKLSSAYQSSAESFSNQKAVFAVKVGQTLKFSIGANPASGEKYHFVCWEDSNGSVFSTQQTLSNDMLPPVASGEELVFKAVFEEDVIYNVLAGVNSSSYGELYVTNSSFTNVIDTYSEKQSSGLRLFKTDRINQKLFSDSQLCLRAVSKMNYSFDHWELNGETISTQSSFDKDYVFTKDSTLIAVFKPTQAVEDQMIDLTFEATNNGKISAGGEPAGSLVIKVMPSSPSIPTVTAVNEDGSAYRFKQWTSSALDEPVEERVLSAEKIKLQDTGNVTVTAEFISKESSNYWLTFASNNNDMGWIARNDANNTVISNPSRSDRVDPSDGGMRFSIKAVCADTSKYKFDHWDLNGKKLSHTDTFFGSHTADLVINRDSVLTAVFVPLDAAIETFTVKYEALTGGSVSRAMETYVVEDSTVLNGSQAKPAAGYLLDGWYQGETKVSSDALFTPSFDDFKDLADENKTVTYTAKFVVDQGTISGSGGSGSGSGASGSGSGASGGNGTGELLLSDLDKQVLSSSSEEGPDGAEYGKLTLRAAKAKKTSIKLKWNAVSGATGYVLYGTKCGTKFERIGLINGTSYTVSSLKKGTYYKYKLVAVKIVGNKQTVVAHSKVVHAATTGGKVGNPKKIVLKSKKKVTLKKGKSSKIKVKVTKPAGKKVKKHRKVAYETSDPKVATVNAKGRITAVGQGTCKIYVYTQNGLYKAVNVKVK